MRRTAKNMCAFVLTLVMLLALMLPAAAADVSSGDELCALPLAPAEETTCTAQENEADKAGNTDVKSTLQSGVCELPLSNRNRALDVLVVPQVESPSARAGYIQVKVSSPCDADWRSDYPNTWMGEANSAVELADDQLYEWFGIDFLSVAQSAWTAPNSNDLGTILNSARDNVGLENGAQIMIAFSGKSPGAGGVARRNTNYCVIFDQGTTNNGYATRHEVGHLYGCPDEYDTETMKFTDWPCLMNNCYRFNDTICDDCYSTWDGNKNTK